MIRRVREMSLKIEAITVLPAMVLFVLSSYVAVVALQATESSIKQGLLAMSLGFFFGGIVLAISWLIYWRSRTGPADRALERRASACKQDSLMLARYG